MQADRSEQTIASRAGRMLAAVCAAVALAGCSAGDVAGNIVGNSIGAGNLREMARAGVGGALDSIQQQRTKFSPEQEYFLGRAVAAEAIAKYGLDPDPARQAYVRKIGASIVRLSSRLKGTYGGYHFAVLDSDEANGLSGPGGYVFITRGALLRCQNEDEVAGILCHELAHVSLQHGESVIRAGSRWQAGAQVLGRLVGAAAGADDNALSSNVSQLLGDVAGDFVRDLSQTGYGQRFEYEADREGSFLLYDVGYDAASIRDYLEASPGRSRQTWSTHPPADERIAALEPVVATWGGVFDDGSAKASRTARFQQLMGGAPAMPTAAIDPLLGEGMPAGPQVGEVVETRDLPPVATPATPPADALDPGR